MTSVPIPSPLMAQAQELARKIALVDGGLEHVQKARDQIHDELKSRESVPEITTVWSGRNKTQYRSKIVTVRPITRYTVRPTEVRQRFPLAYEAARKITPPTYAYQVRLEKAGRGKSREWEAMRAEGAAKAEEVLRGRFGMLDWNIGTKMAVLKQLDLDIAEREQRTKTIRQEFVLFVTDNELPLTLPMTDDGRVRLQENRPTETLDLEILRRYPGAAELIRPYETKGYTYVQFREIKVVADPDEEDELAD